MDPNAGGMQVTSDGKRKVIDRIDASGAGDVDTSKTVEAANGELKGKGFLGGATPPIPRALITEFPFQVRREGP